MDEDEEEEFYVCRWTVDIETSLAILIFAGRKGIVRILDTKNNLLLNVIGFKVSQKQF